MKSTKDITKLAVELTAGTITADFIKDRYGEGVLGSVLAIGGGFATGVVTSKLLDALDEETGIVSDIGSVVDDVLSIFD